MTDFRSERDIVADLKERIGYDLKQQDLADQLKVTPALISLVLRGKRGVSRKLAAKLGYEPMAYFRKK